VGNNPSGSALPTSPQAIGKLRNKNSFVFEFIHNFFNSVVDNSIQDNFLNAMGLVPSGSRGKRASPQSQGKLRDKNYSFFEFNHQRIPVPSGSRGRSPSYSSGSVHPSQGSSMGSSEIEELLPGTPPPSKRVRRPMRNSPPRARVLRSRIIIAASPDRSASPEQGVVVSPRSLSPEQGVVVRPRSLSPEPLGRLRFRNGYLRVDVDFPTIRYRVEFQRGSIRRLDEEFDSEGILVEDVRELVGTMIAWEIRLREGGDGRSCPIEGCSRRNFRYPQETRDHIFNIHFGRRFYCRVPGCNFSSTHFPHVKAHVRRNHP
jgi:hypothetical protein